MWYVIDVCCGRCCEPFLPFLERRKQNKQALLAENRQLTRDNADMKRQAWENRIQPYIILRYTPEVHYGTWKWEPGKWDSIWKPAFPGSMLSFGGLLEWRVMTFICRNPSTFPFIIQRYQLEEMYDLFGILGLSWHRKSSQNDTLHISYQTGKGESSTKDPWVFAGQIGWMWIEGSGWNVRRVNCKEHGQNDSDL